jgi:hypothetical protein
MLTKSSWSSRNDRNSFYSCWFVTCIGLSLYRQSSPWIGISHTLLTFCGCSVIILVHKYLLLRVLIGYLGILFIVMQQTNPFIVNSNPVIIPKFNKHKAQFTFPIKQQTRNFCTSLLLNVCNN